MNNMFEYLTGGQCYECGGKVRYPDGGSTMQQQSPVADINAMGQQPKREPSTIDANAKELMRFLLNQLSKGTSERILKKTLTDSGIKAKQADELLAVAKEEFDKSVNEGDYSVSEQERQMQMQAAQAEQMQMMGQQAGPNSGMDQSMMAMNQQTDQSNMGQDEMQQSEYGGQTLRRIRRMNMGGNSCPAGYEWSDMTGSCMPAASTANTMMAGSGAVNISGKPVQTQQSTKQTTDAYNQNMLQNVDAQDKRRNAQMGYYDKMINNAGANKAQRFNNSMTAMGAIHQQMLNGELPFQQTQVQPPVIPSADPNVKAAFGGLTRFVNGGMKQYGAGGTEDGCPVGYYKGPDGDCLKIFGSDQSKQEYQKQVVDFYNQAGAPGAGMNKAAMMTYDEWQNTGEGKAQDDMYNEMISSPAAYQTYVNDYSTANAGKTGVQAQLSYDDWKAQKLGTSNNTNKDGAPIDPRLTNSPYIVRTDKNKIANLDNNWVNRALAVGSNLGSAQTLGATGAFGPYLQMLLGATGAVSSAALGAKKIFSGNKRTVYDDKGNVFEYDNKRSFKDAGRDSQTEDGDSQNSGSLDGLNMFQKMSIRAKENATQRQIRRGERQNDDDSYSGTSSQNSQNTPNSNTNSVGVSSSDPSSPGYNPNAPGTVPVNTSGPVNNTEDPAAIQYMQSQLRTQQDGGEWNPFVDNRRKLRISMPMYGGGGPINGETTPYTQQEWAQVQSKTFPLKPEDIQPYNDYVANFSNTSGNNASNTNIAGTDNTNNALSANPNAKMVDTKEVTIQRGDALGSRVAQNLYSGLAGFNAGLSQIQGDRRMKQIQKERQNIGNSMEISAVNPINMYGSWQANANQGSNYDLANQGATQDWQTTLNARLGGTKFRRGGTYEVSPEELRAIIAMGGEVEFLD